jgi:hypothetical protein
LFVRQVTARVLIAQPLYSMVMIDLGGPGSDWLWAERFGDRIPVGARFSAPVQTGPGAHPASCTMGTGSFTGVESGRGVTLTPHPLLVLLSLRAFVACKKG